jgi:hypothetical protein
MSLAIAERWALRTGWRSSNGALSARARVLTRVNALAADWGTRSADRGKTVWFELDAYSARTTSIAATDSNHSNTLAAPEVPFGARAV